MRRTLVILLALIPLAGCYHRVVSSKGLGGVNTAVQEPYRSNTAADRAVDQMMGHTDKPVRGADTMPLKSKAKWTAETTGNQGKVE